MLARLAAIGANFDTASLGEIDLCLGQGATAERLSFGNTGCFRFALGLKLTDQTLEEERNRDYKEHDEDEVGHPCPAQHPLLQHLLVL